MEKENIWENTRRIVRTRESWKNYWVFLLITVPLFILSFKLMSEKPTLGKAVAILAIAMWFFHLSIRYWWIHSNSYVIDEDILKIRSGVIFRLHDEIPLRDILKIEIRQTSGEKMLRVGSLAISTKDENPACFIKGVNDPEDIRDHIYKVRDLLLMPKV